MECGDRLEAAVGRKSRSERGCLSSDNLSREGRAEQILFSKPAGLPRTSRAIPDRGAEFQITLALFSLPSFFLLASNLHHLDLPTQPTEGVRLVTQVTKRNKLLHYGQP